jgi:DNA repair exonuclease SbcCD nuclease subunit
MTDFRCRWLLFSDIHFRHQYLDRVRKTASWIIEEAERHQIQRVVVCGDLLTSRTMQPTHVLSECYRFISRLSDVVRRIHILLGNHDLAYRRDYQTTALDALNFKRLAPYVDSVDLDPSLLSRKDELVRIGHRIMQVSHETIDHEEVTANYKDFLQRATQVDGTRTATELAGSPTHVFVSIPRTLTINNFLGI